MAVQATWGSPVRDELLLKTFLGAYGSRTDLRSHVEKAAGRFKQTTQMLAGTMAWLEQSFPDDPSLPYWLLSADRGRRVAQARAEWAEYALEVLAGIDDEPQGLDGGGPKAVRLVRAQLREVRACIRKSWSSCHL